MERENNLLLQTMPRPQVAVRPKVGEAREIEGMEGRDSEGVGGVVTKRYAAVLH